MGYWGDSEADQVYGSALASALQPIFDALSTEILYKLDQYLIVTSWIPGANILRMADLDVLSSNS